MTFWRAALLPKIDPTKNVEKLILYFNKKIINKFIKNVLVYIKFLDFYE